MNPALPSSDPALTGKTVPGRFITAEFCAASETPPRDEPWAQRSALLLNPCDGLHLVYANFDGEGEFIEFNDFAGPMYQTPYTPDFYVAWALLPDEMPLIEHFAPERFSRKTSPNEKAASAVQTVQGVE